MKCIKSKVTGLAFPALLSALVSTTPLIAADDAETVTITYITAARMVDVQTGAVITNPLIAVQDGRILSIANLASTALPQGATVTDLGNRTLLPGLIDMHVHLDAQPKYGGYSGLQFTDTFWSFVAAHNAVDMLHAGFTTVRNLGFSYNDVGLKQAIDEGYAIGPRIIPAANGIGATGGHCDETFYPPSFNRKAISIGDSPDELRKRVREQRKYGAEVIKVCATGGVFSRNTEPGQQQLSEVELRAIADEAHMWGLKVASHAHGTAGIKAAIRAGIDTVEHASLIDDEGITLAKQRGTYLSMDIYNTDYTQAEGRKNGVLEDNLRKDREIAQVQRDNFRKANAAGVKMVFGSDAGVMPHSLVGRQFNTMVQYGMTPLQAIQSATVNAALALGREKDVGVIAVGRYADMIAVDGDPLQNVRELEDVDTVILGGVVITQD
jgi:imidazolonepropionase-like amidohydrolase